MRGALFTRYFLEVGIREMDRYRRLDAAYLDAFAGAVGRHWSHLEQMPHPSEAETESEFIFPILSLLGWEHLPQQEPGRGRHDIADALLFIDAGAKERARPLPAIDRFRLGAVVVENEARDTRLDRGSGSHEAPSTQILRYLGRAEAQTGGGAALGLADQRPVLAALLGAGAGAGRGLCRNRAAGADRRFAAAGAGGSRPPALAAGVHAAVRAQRARPRRARATKPFSISRWPKAGATSSKSPRHCRGSSSTAPTASTLDWCRRSAELPRPAPA